ncbi:MAG TPA: GNAT family N-acetyltransferase, partial [Mycobacteriales bacterium]|nr:GNAT family N-acetyltransferase [Mycobacteriales bacterium]
PPGRSTTASVAEVQQIAAFGWRAQETVRLGEWLLRAAGGFTQRANSVLAVGDPGCDLAAALDVASDWYAERGLPLVVMQADEASPSGLANALAARGCSPRNETHVMTGEIAHALRGMPDAVRSAGRAGLVVELADVPDESWYACYADAAADQVGAARRAVIENHPAVVFASLRDGERVVAVARAAVDARWAGLFAVTVAPDRRRSGLGAAVTLAALKEAARRGGRHVYLQVQASNTAAVELYRRLNLRVHHDYRYWAGPSSK